MRNKLNNAVRNGVAFALLLGAAITATAQADLSGYWILRFKDAGVTYFQLQQKGDTVQSVASGRGGGRGGVSGTVRNGKLDMNSVVNRPPATPGAAPPPARETSYEEPPRDRTGLI